MIKLINAETIISEVGQSDANRVELIDPLQLDLNINEEEDDGYSMIAFLWIPLTLEKTEVILKRDHIIAEVDVGSSLGRYYRRSLAFLTGNEEAILKELSEQEELKMEENQKRQERKGGDNVIPLHTVRVSANTVH